VLKEPKERHGYYNLSEEFREGRLLTLIHRKRERNPSLVSLKKDYALDLFGKIECEVCRFDFEDFCIVLK